MAEAATQDAMAPRLLTYLCGIEASVHDRGVDFSGRE